MSRISKNLNAKFFFLVAVLFCLMANYSFAAALVENSVMTEISRVDSDSIIPLVVLMDNPVNPEALFTEVEGLSHIQARQYVIDRLKNNLAENSQAINQWINNHELDGNLGRVRPLWLANAYLIDLKAGYVDELANVENVSLIHFDKNFLSEEIENDQSDNQIISELDETEIVDWGLVNIGAVELWNLGFKGRGIIAAYFDSGCNIYHDDLENQIWTNPDEIPNDNLDNDNNGLIDDIHGWNYAYDNNDLTDNVGHGTKCAGILVGDGTRGFSTGVAPEAELIAHKIYGNGSSEARYWEAMQYALEKGARVASSSISYKYEQNLNGEPDMEYPAYVLHRIVHTNALAADFIVSNSVGNVGNDTINLPIPWNVSAPANCPPPWITPEQSEWPGGLSDVIGVGAYEEDGGLYGRTAWGPSEWYRADFPVNDTINFRDYPWINGTFIGLLKPDIVAPCDVRSTYNNSYASFGGTSCASPHVGGSLILLRSIHQQATPAEIYESIVMSAESDYDHWHNRYGYGKLRLYDAHLYLDSLIAYGQLEVANSNRDVDSFMVKLNEGEVLGWSENGIATLQRVQPGDYTLDITDYNDNILYHEETVTIVEDEITIRDLTGVNDNQVEVPQKHQLLPAYPNPFNPSVNLKFVLSSTENVSLKIFNLQGREIIELINGSRTTGSHCISWNAEDYATGVYFAELKAGQQRFIQKLMLVK